MQPRLISRDGQRPDMIGRATFVGTRFEFSDDLTWRPVADDPYEVAPGLNRLSAQARGRYGPSKGSLAHWLFLEVIEIRMGEDAEMIPPEDGGEEAVY